MELVRKEKKKVKGPKDEEKKELGQKHHKDWLYLRTEVFRSIKMKGKKGKIGSFSATKLKRSIKVEL